MTTPIRVFLVDDHTLVRAGIHALLQSMTNVEVVGEAGDGQEALRSILKHQPDVILLDIAMSGLNGLEVAVRLAKEAPAVRVVMLSMHANEEYVMRALQAGVAGYLLKDSAAAELELALKAVERGEKYLSPVVSRQVISYVQRIQGQEKEGLTFTPSLLNELTSRQREILQLIAEGKTTKEIATLLHLSIKTVETHRAQLMSRLNIHDIAGLVRYAVRIGLVSLEE